MSDKDYDTTVHLTQSEARVIYSALQDMAINTLCQVREPAKPDSYKLCFHCAANHGQALLRVGGYEP